MIKVCDDKHVSHQWCSQPQLNPRLHSGDFLICGTILSSGNNYGKMALCAEMLLLKFPSADQFHRICSTYIIPSIDNFWTDHRDGLLQDLQDKDVVVLGIIIHVHCCSMSLFHCHLKIFALFFIESSHAFCFIELTWYFVWL